MGKQTLKEKVFIDYVNGLVESAPNPDFAKTILYRGGFMGELYLEKAHEFLDISRGEFDKTFDYLLQNELVFTEDRREPINSPIIKCNEDVSFYLDSDLPFGTENVLNLEQIDKDLTFKLLNSVSDIVNFSYLIQVDTNLFPKLKNLKKRSLASLKKIKKEEEKYWHEALGIPKQFNKGFPSFVCEEETRRNIFNLEGKFDSLEEAFSVGFHQVSGFPITPEYLVKKEEAFCFPKTIEVSMHYKGGYILRLTNLARDVNFVPYHHSSFPFRMEAKRVAGVLEERLKSVLEKEQ